MVQIKSEKIKMRYERRLRMGGEYLYDTEKECVLQLPEACKLLNKNNKHTEEFLEDLREIISWNELPSDSETNIRLKRKEKKWEERNE